MGLHGLLRDIGEHGIGASEADGGHRGEEGRDPGEDIVGSEQQEKREHRRQPQHQTGQGIAQNLPMRWA